MEFTPQAILYQAILFVALYFVLKRLVFGRFVENLEARHRRTQGALEEAMRLREEAGRLQADYEAQMAEMRRRAAAAKEEIRRQAEKGERELLDLARGEAARSLAQAQAEIAEQVRAARAALEGDVNKLSEQVLDRLLKRPS